MIYNPIRLTNLNHAAFSLPAEGIDRFIINQISGCEERADDKIVAC
jgi:hypothetical protein